MQQEPQFLPSLMHGLYTTQSRPVTWDEVYQIITTDETVKQQTGLYRSTCDEKYKHALPAVTTAVQLDGKGKAMENIVGYTGVTHCDLDHVSEERLDEVLLKIKTDPHTFLCNVSPSGRGVHIYAKFSVEDLNFYANCQKINREFFLRFAMKASQSAERIEKLNIPSEENNFMDNLRIIDSNLCSQMYDMAFMSVNCYYADLLGLSFDEQCSNPNKTLSLSHDADAYFNPNAEVFKVNANYQKIDREFFLRFAMKASQSAERIEKLGIPSEENNFTDNLRTIDGNSRSYKEKHHGRYVKNYLNPIEFAEEYVRNRRGLTYTEGCRNAYLYECLNMMNLLGVPRTDAENWLRGFDLPEREKMSVLKSAYKRTADFGKFEQPYRWEQVQVDNHIRETPNLQSYSQPEASYTRVRENPRLPEYAWPRFLQQMVDCGETAAQRDVILLSALVVIGSLVAKLVRIPYGHKSFYPCVQCFVIAPPASGKGCIGWVRKLAEPLHKARLALWQQKLAIYRKEKAAYDIAGNKRAEMEVPVEPPMSMFIITGNNSGTGILENLMDAGGHALICEVEADTMSESINADYGGWSYMVREAFEHMHLAYNRRTNHEYREIDTLRLSVLLSGTPAQVKPLIPSAENGLFSRQIFYMMPTVEEWIDQFTENETDYDDLFAKWGEEWRTIQQGMEKELSLITLQLTGEQKRAFNECFIECFSHAVCTHSDYHAKSSVIRMAINILRFMSVVALLRALEEGKGMEPSPTTHADNRKDGICPKADLSIRDDDFRAVLDFVDPLYRHAMQVLRLLPTQEAECRKQTPMEILLEGLPMRFSRKEMLAAAKSLHISEGAVDQELGRMMARGLLCRTERGQYMFTSPSHGRK